MSAAFELTIRPRKGWQPIDLKRALLYHELLAFLRRENSLSADAACSGRSCSHL